MSDDRAGSAFFVLVGLAAVTASCSQGLFDPDRGAYQVPTAKLERIATTDIVAESTQQPITPEAATQAALDRGDPKPVWLSQADVTLTEVREATLRNNLDLRTQLVEPSIARRTLDAERAKFEATLVGSFNRNAPNLFSDPPFGGIDSTNSGSIGIDFPLITGGTFGISADTSQADGATGFEFDGAGDWTSGLGFSISQPLLRNAGVDVNTASIRIADHNGQIASARTKLETIRILANAEKTYWSLYAAYRELEVRNQQFELAKAQLDRARRRVERGDAPEIEVTRAESGLGATIENIILASAAVREQARALKRVMNRPEMPIESVTLLVPKSDPNPLGLALDSAELADRAVENRMEMLELELELATKSIEIAFARNQALPSFVVDYRYEPTGTGSSFGRSVSNFGDFESDQYAVGVSGSIPLGNEAAKNRLARVILERVQRLATKDARRQAIRVEVFDAVERLETAWQRILAARLETVLAARTYEGEKRQFDVGVRTSQDVLDASTRLADAQSREVRALAQWQIAMVDIAFATGTLAGMSGATWSAIDMRELERESMGGLEDASLRQTQ